MTNSRIQELIPKLRTAWGEAAGILEEHWAEKIVTAASQDEGQWESALTMLGAYLEKSQLSIS